MIDTREGYRGYLTLAEYYMGSTFRIIENKVAPIFIVLIESLLLSLALFWCIIERICKIGME